MLYGSGQGKPLKICETAMRVRLSFTPRVHVAPPDSGCPFPPFPALVYCYIIGWSAAMTSGSDYKGKAWQRVPFCEYTCVRPSGVVWCVL